MVRSDRTETQFYCDMPLIIGHRGASHAAPENTLASFRLAVNEGADCVEGDFWLTSDNEIVCHHDATTERTAPGQQGLRITKSSIVELKSLDVGSWKNSVYSQEKIPTLFEILHLLPIDRGLFIEVKDNNPQFVHVLEQTLRRAQTSRERVRVISFFPEVVALTKTVLPEVQCYLLFDPQKKSVLPFTGDRFSRAIKTALAVNADGIDSGFSAQAGEDFSLKLQKNNLELHFWTVNRLSDALHCISLGAQSITTDTPGLLRQELLLYFSGRR